MPGTFSAFLPQIEQMRIHLIAVGGAVMHNLALALQDNHHTVSGSDDEIYDPARSRLAAAGLLPDRMGWDEARITPDIELVILGMHARADNPELLRAQALGLPIQSFPEYIAAHGRDKLRVAVCGSHGKTTTTAMIMHVLRHCGRDFDYLVGAQLEGFETMVRLSDAPVLIVEGDEYLSSAIDRNPKFLHYRPQLTVITGIAWDHINVFPTEAEYIRQFERLLITLPAGGALMYDSTDPILKEVVRQTPEGITRWPYTALPVQQNQRIRFAKAGWHLRVFGAHNYKNMAAARLVCAELGIDGEAFFGAMESFTGAAKRLDDFYEDTDRRVWKDFAHAPSKVRATTAAVKARYPERPLTAVLELHTFSSLNQDFLPQYAGALDAADRAFVYYSPHTLAMKRLPVLDADTVRLAFGRPDLEVLTEADALEAAVATEAENLLLMSSGRWDGFDWAAELQRKSGRTSA